MLPIHDVGRQPDEGQLIKGAINGTLSALDPHSSYVDAKSFGDMQVESKGEFGGLGIEVTLEDGIIKVVAPIDDTPAAKAEAVEDLTLDQAVDKMYGAPFTSVTLRIVRSPKKEVKDRSFATLSRYSQYDRTSRAATLPISASRSSQKRPMTG